jgi:hypothetical protein
MPPSQARSRLCLLPADQRAKPVAAEFQFGTVDSAGREVVAYLVGKSGQHLFGEIGLDLVAMHL